MVSDARIHAIEQQTWPERVKTWPVLGCRAISAKRGGAWRIWVWAKAIDTAGSGKVARKDLLAYTRFLGVHERNRRRWLADALAIGLLREHRKTKNYYLVSLARAARILGASTVGKPVTISASALARTGWRSLVFLAYEATLRERPVSQRVKHQITGISPRNQRYLRVGRPGKSIHNYCDRGKASNAFAEGAREVLGLAFFVTKGGRLIQRLPDSRRIPAELATPANRGRTRKAQKQLNFLLKAEQEPQKFFQLFYYDPKQAKLAKRRIEKAGMPPGELEEIFEYLPGHAKAPGSGARFWRPLEVGV